MKSLKSYGSTTSPKGYVSTKSPRGYYERYAQVPGGSGSESNMLRTIRDYWEESYYLGRFDLSPSSDWMTYSVGVNPKVRFILHVDTLSFTVKSYEGSFVFLDNGQRAERSKSLLDRWVVGRQAKITNRGGWTIAKGIFAMSTGHVRDTPVSHVTADDIYIDLLGEEGFPELIGGSVTWDVPIEEKSPYVTGGYADNRALVGVIDSVMATLQTIHPDGIRDFQIVFTTQEENGSHGAASFAAQLPQTSRDIPHIVLDIGLVGDIPDVDRRQYPLVLGAGPIIASRDLYTHYTESVFVRLRNAVRNWDLPLQVGVFSNYYSDGVPLQEAGCPVGLLTLPVRYPHSTYETWHSQDFIWLHDIIVGLITQEF
jgi:putative aminopeptidase FrvX